MYRICTPAGVTMHCTVAGSLACVLQAVGEVLPSCGRRQRLAVLPVEIDGLFYDLAKLLEDSSFVAPVDAKIRPGALPT